MYSVCYVVADNEKLVFYNEMLISLSSLRKQNFEGPVIIFTDKLTAEEIERQNRSDYKDFDAELRVIETPNAYTQIEKSRYIKTSIREYLKGDFLFIDTDTVIAEPLFDYMGKDFAMVLDFNTRLSERPESDLQYLEGLNRACGYTLAMNEPYYNSGCIWAKDKEWVYDFFHKWNDEWERCRKHGCVKDQPSLNHINISMGGVIQEMDGEYNVQISGTPTPIQLLHKARIIHYFKGACNTYLLQSPNYKSLGYNNELIQRVVASPKEAFAPVTLIPLKEYEQNRALNETSIYLALRKIYNEHPVLFRIINNPFSFLRRIHSKEL